MCLTLPSLFHRNYSYTNLSTMLPLSFLRLNPQAVQHSHCTPPFLPQSDLKALGFNGHKKSISPLKLFFWRYILLNEYNLMRDLGGTTLILLSKTESVLSEVSEPISGGKATHWIEKEEDREVIELSMHKLI